MIYFDNAASMKPCRAALDAFSLTAERHYANPSALHSAGIAAEKIVFDSADSLLSHFPPGGKLLFTSGATESNNLAIMSALEAGKNSGKRVVTTGIEHKSVSEVFRALSQSGRYSECEITELSPKDFPDKEAFTSAVAGSVDDRTVLVSAMGVNNETGYTIDMPYLYREIKRRNKNTIVHSDYAAGFLKTRMEGDLISVSAHKIGGIKGVGGLYYKKGVRLSPMMFGGGQQKGLRPGTIPVELIAAFAAAAEWYGGFVKNCENSREIDKLLQLLRELPDITINGAEHNFVNFSVVGVPSEIMLHYLAENDIFVSSGSACSSKVKENVVLRNIGVKSREAASAIRVSFSPENTVSEVEILASYIGKAIQRFRR
ncbi:class V aminotransferase [Clostridia bacterium]|nr:class V aminotransferase [Clostridia bacterium]